MQLAIVLGALLVSACADDGGVGRPSVPASTKLVDLTAAQEGELCDYVADLEGGYGFSKMCGDGITVRVKDRASCIAMLEGAPTSCTATVGDAEACAAAASGDLCKLLSAAECEWAFSCTPPSAN